MFRVAIIGAGMAGLTCADALASAGLDVTLFDKGRGPGGRMATRRLETTKGTASFDFGAQYFTVRDERFARQVEIWEAAGVVSRWPEARPDAFVGQPTMNAVLCHIASRHEVHFSSLIKGLKKAGQYWQLLGEGQDSAIFEAVVLALPAEQTAPILTLHDFELAQSALFARSQPCWTGMFAFARKLPVECGIIRDSGIIAWAARDNAKPGRSGPESWVVQAIPQWSNAHMETPSETISMLLLNALQDHVGKPLPAVIAQSVHRWRYGLSAGTGDVCLWNPGLRLGACGDWLIGPRVECAWISGQQLAERMLGAETIAAE